MQARYYDPVIGRFYSNDPIGFRDVHSFNRYAYANNNPYKYTDPDGNNPVAIGRFVAPPPIIQPTSSCVGQSTQPAYITSGGRNSERTDRFGNLVFNESSEGGIRGQNGRSTDDPVDMEEDLAGQEILGDFASGGGNDISEKMGDKARYGENGTHDKLTGSKEHSDGTKTEVHGDRDRKTGELSDTKFKDAPDNSKSRNEIYP